MSTKTVEDHLDSQTEGTEGRLLTLLRSPAAAVAAVALPERRRHRSRSDDGVLEAKGSGVNITGARNEDSDPAPVAIAGIKGRAFAPLLEGASSTTAHNCFEVVKGPTPRVSTSFLMEGRLQCGREVLLCFNRDREGSRGESA